MKTKQAITVDLDLFVEHESLRMRYMEEMNSILPQLENASELDKNEIEGRIKKIVQKVAELDSQDRRNVNSLIKWGKKTGDGKLIAQLEALKERHDGNMKSSEAIFDLVSLKEGIKKRIGRGVGTFLLCGAIAMGIGSGVGPHAVSLTSSSDGMSNREEVHYISNISTMFEKQRR